MLRIRSRHVPPKDYYKPVPTLDLITIAAGGGMTDRLHNHAIWFELAARRARHGTLAAAIEAERSLDYSALRSSDGAA